MFSASTSYWLYSAVHADVHRVGEVGVGAVLLVEHDLVHLVVGLEHHFGVEVGDQALELHAHGGGVAAAAAVFGLEHDHRVLAVHDDVAGADFLSDFHSQGLWMLAARCVCGAGSLDACTAAGSADGAAEPRTARPEIRKARYFSRFGRRSCRSRVTRSSCASRRARAACTVARHWRERSASSCGSGAGLDAVPDAMEVAQRRRRLQPVEEGLELGVMGVVVLRIDLPDEGLAGPQRAHQRILAAHEVQVAGPQQVVEVGLRSAAAASEIEQRAAPAPARGGSGRAAARGRRSPAGACGSAPLPAAPAARPAPAARSRTG